MHVRVLKVPYDSGHRCERMARGPGYLLSKKVLAGHEAESIESTYINEVQCAFDLAREIATRVSAIRASGDFPVILSGNCNSALGTISGLGPLETGVLWFDAHGEFNTPETTTSGFFDGMPLAIATGRCWKLLAESIPGFTPLPDENIALIGVRDTNAQERQALDASGIAQLPSLSGLIPVLDRIAARVRHWYVHLDLDALDPSEATSNEWVPPHGLTAAGIANALEEAARRRPIAAVTLASLDPSRDTDERALTIARRLLDQAVGLAGA